MSSVDQNSIIPPNSGDFKKFKKAKWFYNPFYRNFIKNWWDSFLRNLDRKSDNFTTKFIEKNLHPMKENEVASEDNSYIYMDDVSETSQEEDNYGTDEAINLKQKESEDEDLKDVTNKPKVTKKKKEGECGSCNSDHSDDSSRVENNSQLSEEVESVENLENKIHKMMDSFRFLENLAVDLRENYGNCTYEPLFCIFSLHCPQREKSLMHLYQKIVKVRNKLRKLVQEQNKPEINI